MNKKEIKRERKEEIDKNRKKRKKERIYHGCGKQECQT